MRFIDLLTGIIAISAASSIFVTFNPYTWNNTIPSYPMYNLSSGYNPTGSAVGTQIGDILWGVQWFFGWALNSINFVPTILSNLGVPTIWISAFIYISTFIAVLYLVYFITSRKTVRGV